MAKRFLSVIALFVIFGAVSFSNASEVKSHVSVGLQETVNDSTTNYDDFKKELKRVLVKYKKQLEKGDTTVRFSEAEIEALNKKCLELLKAEGFEESRFEEYKDAKDLRFVAITMMYVGMMESQKEQTKSESDSVPASK